MRKAFYGFIIILFLFTLTSCKQFLSDIDEVFDYWVSTVRIVETEIPSSVIDEDGYPCLSSDEDKLVKLKLVNPKRYKLKLPSDPNAPSDIVKFEDGVQGSDGSSPKYGVDYELKLETPSELHLIYKRNFLITSEFGSQNLSPTINFYNDGGRKFGAHTFKLRCNTPPLIVPNDSDIKIGKTTDSFSCYVLCFKYVNAADLLQQDVNELCFKTDETEYVRNFSVSDTGDVNPDAEYAAGAYALVNISNVTALLPGDLPASAGSPDILPTGSDVICLKTDIQVVPGGGASKSFELWLKDKKGLKSAVRQKSIGGIKLSSPDIFAAHMSPPLDSGVYTKTGAMDKAGNSDVNGGLLSADGLTPDNAIPVYSAYGQNVELKVNKGLSENYPQGVVIKGRVSIVSGTTAAPSFIEGIGGTSGMAAEVRLPAAGETVYKLEIWAEGPGFDQSNVRTLYYKVLKEINADTDALVPTWGILKKAVEEKTPDGGTVTVSGTIISTNAADNFGEIVINKNITVKGKIDKNSDIIDANSNHSGTPYDAPASPHRIFKIKSGKTLTLKNLMLKNGKALGSEDEDKCGGAVYVESGGNLSLTDVNMENNEAAKKGGAVYLADGTFTMKGSSYIGPGADGKNDVYLAGSKTITVDGNLAIPPAANGIAALISTNQTDLSSGYILNTQLLSLINGANKADCNLFKLARAIGVNVTGEASSGIYSTKYGIQVKPGTTDQGVIVSVGSGQGNASVNIQPYEPSPYVFELNPSANTIVFLPPVERKIIFTLKRKGSSVGSVQALDPSTRFKLKMELYQNGSSLASLGEDLGVKTGSQNENGISITLPAYLPVGIYQLYLKAEIDDQFYDGWKEVKIE